MARQARREDQEVVKADSERRAPRATHRASAAVCVVLASLAGLVAAAAPAPAPAPDAATAPAREDARGVINTMCPVLPDEAVDPEIVVEHEGRLVGLCCQRCKRKFLADPGAYAANLALLAVADGVATEAAPAGGKCRGRGRGGEGGGGGDDAAGREGGGRDGREGRGGGGDERDAGERLLRFAGRLHPAVVHFPIALLVVGAALEAFSWLTRRARASEAAQIIVPLGAAAALLAMGLGLAAEEFAESGGEAHDVLERHETLGITTALLSVAVAVLGRVAARRGGAWLVVYRLALIAVAALVSVTGYVGGEVVFGSNHLFR